MLSALEHSCKFKEIFAQFKGGSHVRFVLHYISGAHISAADDVPDPADTKVDQVALQNFIYQG